MKTFKEFWKSQNIVKGVIPNVDYSRKPFSFSDVGATVEASRLVGLNLPEYMSRDIYANQGNRINTTDSFTMSVPQHFILNRGGTKYLVNTEGFDYARYMSRII